MTQPQTPPMGKSNEAEPEQLDIAREQGRALAKAIDAMAQEAPLQKQRAGDYLVVVAAEKAEGMYGLDGGELTWHPPSEEANCHIEVAVVDGADGRFVPELDVTVRITGEDGTDHGEKKMPFLWHPFLYHYGHNWTVPGKGRYDLHVHIEPPTFLRHDPKNGRRYGEPVDVTFQGLELETGVKPSPDASPRGQSRGAAQA